MTARLGVDFGGVIVRNRQQVPAEDTGICGSDETGLAHDGMFAAMRAIVSMFNDHVWIVSKAGPRMQEKTRAWLDVNDFFAQTGLSTDRVRFCLERQEKADICRELGITHFVDDRIHVMQILRHIVPYLYLFGDRGREKFCPPWATFVADWQELVEQLTESLREGRR